MTSVPFTTLALVPHSSGGAILHYAGSYVSGTFVGSAVVSAFSAASTALASVGSVLSSPYVAGGVAVTVAATAAYCYFFGIPAPAQMALLKAGLAAPAQGGFAVPIAKLSATLMLLGAAGLMTFNIYKRVREARGAQSRRTTCYRQS